MEGKIEIVFEVFVECYWDDVLELKQRATNADDDWKQRGTETDDDWKQRGTDERVTETADERVTKTADERVTKTADERVANTDDDWEQPRPSCAEVPPHILEKFLRSYGEGRKRKAETTVEECGGERKKRKKSFAVPH